MKPRVGVYLSEGMAARLAEAAKSPRATKSALVEAALERLQFLSEYIRIPTSHFEYQRDPRDEKFIELAIAGRATQILSFDKDLLELPYGHTDAANRFRQRLPGVEVVRPREFMEIVL